MFARVRQTGKSLFRARRLETKVSIVIRRKLRLLQAVFKPRGFGLEVLRTAGVCNVFKPRGFRLEILRTAGLYNVFMSIFFVSEPQVAGAALIRPRTSTTGVHVRPTISFID